MFATTREVAAEDPSPVDFTVTPDHCRKSECGKENDDKPGEGKRMRRCRLSVMSNNLEVGVGFQGFALWKLRFELRQHRVALVFFGNVTDQQVI